MIAIAKPRRLQVGLCTRTSTCAGYRAVAVWRPELKVASLEESGTLGRKAQNRKVTTRWMRMGVEPRGQRPG